MSSKNLISINEVEKDFNNVIIDRYISISFKKKIVENVKNLSTKTIDGFKTVDYFTKEVALMLSLINQYTNIDISEFETEELFDKMIQIGLVDYVLKNIPKSELDFINTVLDKEIEYELNNYKNIMYIEKINEIFDYIQENSIEAQLKKFLEMAIEKIPNDKKIISMVKELKKQFNGFKPEKLKFLNDTLKEIGQNSVPSKEQLQNTGDEILRTMGVKTEGDK